MINILIIKEKKTNSPKIIIDESFRTWCGKYHPLVIKDMYEVINDSLFIFIYINWTKKLWIFLIHNIYYNIFIIYNTNNGWEHDQVYVLWSLSKKM
jgi:hypothetical protein